MQYSDGTLLGVTLGTNVKLGDEDGCSLGCEQTLVNIFQLHPLTMHHFLPEIVLQKSLGVRVGSSLGTELGRDETLGMTLGKVDGSTEG